MKMRGAENPLVSVIVPTKNSSSTLKECLESVSGQTYDNIEIIVVDNYSNDNTIEIAKYFTDKIFTMGPERSSQVNFGAKEASGKYLYRVDSDFYLDSEIVKEAVSNAEANNYVAILVHNTSDSKVSFWSQVRKFERDMYSDDSTNVAVRFILKEAFDSVGGFDEELVAGEDYDLHNRIIKKYDNKIGRISPKEIHLGESKSLIEIAQKHYYYGKSIDSFLKKNRTRGLKQISPFRIAYFKNFRKFIRHPHLTMGFFIYQVVRYGSTALGILAHKSRK